MLYRGFTLADSAHYPHAILPETKYYIIITKTGAVK
jgi:hypothetical protein